MGARFRVFLDAAEDRTLFELRRATTVPQRVQDRAEVVRLSHQGMYVEQIAALFNWHERTVRETFSAGKPRDAVGGGRLPGPDRNDAGKWRIWNT